MKNVTCRIHKQRKWEPCSQQHLKPPQNMHPERIYGPEKQVLALENEGVYERIGFNEPRFLHLSMYRKALSSLTCDV